MSVLYCTRPGKIQYRSSRRVSEYTGESRLLSDRCVVNFYHECLSILFFFNLKATGKKENHF